MGQFELGDSRGALIVQPLSSLMSTAVTELNERAAAAGMDDVAGLATNPRALRRWIRGDIDLLFTSPELGVDRRRILLTWASRRARPATARPSTVLFISDTPQARPSTVLYPTPHIYICISRRRQLRLLAVDEAHLVELAPFGWAFPFRPSYLGLQPRSLDKAAVVATRATHAAPRPQHHPLNFRPHLGSSPRPPTSAPTGGSAVPTGNPPPRPSPPSLTLPQARPHRGLPAEGAQRVQRHAHV